MNILRQHWKKIVVLFVLVTLIILITSNSKLQGSWYTTTQNGNIVCFDFDGDNFVYILDNGGVLYGEFKVKKDCIYLTDYKGREYTYRYEKNKDTLIIEANDGKYVLAENSNKVKKSNLKKYHWKVDGTKQELYFKGNKCITINSAGTKTECKYKLMGVNNEFLMLEDKDSYLLLYIECSGKELIAYDNAGIPILYEGN